MEGRGDATLRLTSERTASGARTRCGLACILTCLLQLRARRAAAALGGQSVVLRAGNSSLLLREQELQICLDTTPRVRISHVPVLRGSRSGGAVCVPGDDGAVMMQGGMPARCGCARAAAALPAKTSDSNSTERSAQRPLLCASQPIVGALFCSEAAGAGAWSSSTRAGLAPRSGSRLRQVGAWEPASRGGDGPPTMHLPSEAAALQHGCHRRLCSILELPAMRRSDRVSVDVVSRPRRRCGSGSVEAWQQQGGARCWSADASGEAHAPCRAERGRCAAAAAAPPGHARRRTQGWRPDRWGSAVPSPGPASAASAQLGVHRPPQRGLPYPPVAALRPAACPSHSLMPPPTPRSHSRHACLSARPSFPRGACPTVARQTRIKSARRTAAARSVTAALLLCRPQQRPDPLPLARSRAALLAGHRLARLRSASP
jgi:hypothetical protein